jgi:hypothetical protein
MTEPPSRYASRGHRADGPSPEAIAASLAFQMPGPSAPEPVPAPVPQVAALTMDRPEMVRRLLAARFDWRRFAMLTLDVRGPAALTDESLRTAVEMLAALTPESSKP